MASFLELLGSNVAGYLPIDGLSRYVEGGKVKPLSAAQLQAFDEVFEAFIPPDALRGNRDVVLFQKSDSGDSLRLLKPVLQRWMAAKGYGNQIKIVGMTTADKQGPQAGLDDVMVFSSATFGEIGTRSFNLIAPYEKFRPGSSKNGPNDLPYDLNRRPKPPAANAKLFRASLKHRMDADAALAQWAQGAQR